LVTITICIHYHKASHPANLIWNISNVSSWSSLENNY
jgi:hypothetical protein